LATAVRGWLVGVVLAPEAGVSAELVPVTQKAARAFVAEHHRHSAPPRGDVFRVGLEIDGMLVGVVMAGRPTAAGLQDGRTLEVTRLCTLGDDNACSMLYGAACRAARALGYRRVYTYTLAGEHGSSLKAAGFVLDGDVAARASWSFPNRPRYDSNLFGERTRDPGPKHRWVRELG